MLALSALAATVLTSAPQPADRAIRDLPADATTTIAEKVTEPTAAPRRFRLGRAGLEIGAAMAVGVAWYQSEIELNKLDFDFDRTWSDQWRRVSTSAGYRLDDNNPTLNVGHAFMGSIYHQFARANGGSMAEAMLFDFVTSTTWELTVEHREVVSINDTVVTSLGGVALGESLFQLGDYFGRSQPTFVNRALMSVLSPAHAVAWLTGDLPARAQSFEGAAGLAGDADHRFGLSVGGAQSLPGANAVTTGEGGEAWRGDLRLDLELVNLAEYGRARRSHRNLSGGEFTRIEAQLVGGRDQWRNQSLSARASLWGRYTQETTLVADETEPARIDGSAWFVGTATAFDLTSDVVGPANDFVAAMHLIGPAVDATFFRDRWRFRMGADVNPDFALVRPFALRDVPTGLARTGMKSTLQDSDYYYALGVHSAARLEAAYRRRVRAGVGMSFTHFDSIEGLDRHQRAYTSPTGIRHEGLTRDENLTDQRLKVRLYSEAPLPLTDLAVGVSLDYQHRAGTAAARERTGEDVRWGVHASYAM